MATFQNKTVREILEYYKTVGAITAAQNLAEWDVETYMPEDGSDDRGFVIGKLETLSQQLVLNKDFLSLVVRAEREPNLTDDEKGVLRTLRRDIDHYTKLPPAFIEEFEETANKAQIVWRNAREKDDFAAFQPYLEKLVTLCRKKADYLGYANHPYDALLDEFEEGWTKADVERYFASIREPLQKLLAYIKSSPRYAPNHPLEAEPYDRAAAEELNRFVLSLMGFDPKTCRLDVSTHPFTENITSHDVRITTRYRGVNIQEAIAPTAHEYGHAIYELQIDPALDFTPAAGGVSMGIHESQSRFWENMIARSPEFLERLYGKTKELVPAVAKYPFEEFVRYFNTVKPGLIRVEADEVTYHFHIMLRFEIETKLMEGALRVADLPEYWSETLNAYLGVKPKTNREGVLQDIHWSSGNIGYFPTYSLGTFISGMWREALEQKYGAMGDLVKRADGVQVIRSWLRDNLHTYGAVYTPKELMKRATGKDFTPQPFLSYLDNKYRKLY